MSSRIITVHGISPYMKVNGKFIEVPSIRIQGKWVEKLGFQVGCRVEVLESKGELTVRLVKEQTVLEVLKDAN